MAKSNRQKFEEMATTILDNVEYKTNSIGVRVSDGKWVHGNKFVFKPDKEKKHFKHCYLIDDTVTPRVVNEIFSLSRLAYLQKDDRYGVPLYAGDTIKVTKSDGSEVELKLVLQVKSLFDWKYVAAVMRQVKDAYCIPDYDNCIPLEDLDTSEIEFIHHEQKTREKWARLEGISMEEYIKNKS